MTERSNDFQMALDIADLQRRIEDLESDIKSIKPIVYDTASSVRNIERAVEKMEKNSDKIRGYFLAAAISGIIGIVFIALQNSLIGG